MTKVLKEWIGPTAVKELEGALDYLDPNYVSGKSEDARGLICCPDAVTVTLTKGRMVQILKVNLFVRATLYTAS